MEGRRCDCEDGRDDCFVRVWSGGIPRRIGCVDVNVNVNVDGWVLDGIDIDAIVVLHLLGDGAEAYVHDVTEKHHDGDRSQMWRQNNLVRFVLMDSLLSSWDVLVCQAFVSSIPQSNPRDRKRGRWS